jgi:hypothetical protein
MSAMDFITVEIVTKNTTVSVGGIDGLSLGEIW